MNLDDLAERYRDFYSPRFRVIVDDEEFRESDGVISSVEVDTTLDGADRFSITLAYPFDHEDGAFGDLDWGLFQAGTSVTIWMGYGDHLGSAPVGNGSEPEPMFIGKITSVKPDYPEQGDPTVEVSGYGLLHEMTRGTNSVSWDARPVVEVVHEIAAEYFGEQNVYVAGADLQPEKSIQENQNDYRFLERIANKYGFELFTRLDTFHFEARNPRDVRIARRDPRVTLRYGESLSSFSPEINDSARVGAVEVRHWDPARKREIVGSAELENGAEGKNVLRVPVQSKEEADSVAVSELKRISEVFVQGNGECWGIPEIRAGETVELRGLDDMFTKNYYVKRATHRMNSSGYRTSFDVTERTV